MNSRYTAYFSLKARIKLRWMWIVSKMRRHLGLSAVYYMRRGESIAHAIASIHPGDTIIVPLGEYKNVVTLD